MLTVRTPCIVPAWIAVAVAGSGSALAQVTVTRSFTPVADTFVSGAPDRVSQNFGAAGALAFSPWVGSPNADAQSLLRFDLSGMPAQMDAKFGPGAWSLDSATLGLWAVAPSHPIFNPFSIGTYSVGWLSSDSWVEGTGTPDVPTTDGLTRDMLWGYLLSTDEGLGTFSFLGTPGPFSGSLSLEPGFTADIEAGGLVTLFLHAETARAVFISRQAGAPASQHPTLTVVVTGPCRADLTAGAIVGSPAYGVPDGILSNDDFFYFLAQFAAGNVAITDLTTSAIVGQPGYGIPNGVLNFDDFFFYLAAFAGGC